MSEVHKQHWTEVWRASHLCLYSLRSVVVEDFRGTHSAEGLELFVRDETSIQTEQEDGGVGQHASQDDQVVHIRTGHLDQPGREHKVILHQSRKEKNRVDPIHHTCFGSQESEMWKVNVPADSWRLIIILTLHPFISIPFNHPWFSPCFIHPSLASPSPQTPHLFSYCATHLSISPSLAILYLIATSILLLSELCFTNAEC